MNSWRQFASFSCAPGRRYVTFTYGVSDVTFDNGEFDKDDVTKWALLKFDNPSGAYYVYYIWRCDVTLCDVTCLMVLHKYW